MRGGGRAQAGRGVGGMGVRNETNYIYVSVSPCLSLCLPVSPCLSLSLPVSACLSLSLRVSPCLSLSLPVSHLQSALGFQQRHRD